ncbi:hypothetical protein HY251_08300 [bacterium]|nr:hypothetical protein [bacterium]
MREREKTSWTPLIDEAPTDHVEELVDKRENALAWLRVARAVISLEKQRSPDGSYPDEKVVALPLDPAKDAERLWYRRSRDGHGYLVGGAGILGLGRQSASDLEEVAPPK